MNDEEIAYIDTLYARRFGWAAVTEATLSRVYQQAQRANAESSFLLATAYRSPSCEGNVIDDTENQKNQQELISWIRGKGWGFNHIEGEWDEDCPDGRKIHVKQPSLFITAPKGTQGPTQGDAVAVTKKYHQDAVIYGGPDTGGEAVFVDEHGAITPLGKFHAGTVEKVYSRIKGKDFRFECVPHGFQEHYLRGHADRSVLQPPLASLTRKLRSILDES